LQYLNYKLRQDREIVKAAVAQNGLALEFAYVTLANDKEVVDIAMKQNADAYQFISYNLKHSDEGRAWLEAAVKKDGLLLKHATLNQF